MGLIVGICGGWQGGGSPLRAVSEVMKHRSIEPGEIYFEEMNCM